MALPEKTRAKIVEMLRRDDMSLRDIARTVGVDHTTVMRIRDLKWPEGESPAAESAEKPLVPEPTEVRLKAKIAALEKRLKETQQANLSFEEVRASILGLAETPPAPPAWVAEEHAGKDTPGTPVLLLSDWHAGEVVKPAEVGYVNRFNRDVLRKRVHMTVENAIMLATQYAANPQYPGAVVALLGDMVTGEIHDELTRTNDMDALPAVLEVVDLLTAGLRRLADVFGKLFVPCVSGNHGRTDKRLQAKTFTARNFDWLIYSLVERNLGAMHDGRITIYNPASNEAAWTVAGHRFLALHGHDLGVKGGDGIIGALGPIMRGRLKVGAQQASLGRDFDTLVIGHWHQYITLPGLVVNNALKGYDEFAAKFLRAKPSRPSQALFYVHPKQGITSHWQVFCEPPVENVRARHGLLWG